MTMFVYQTLKTMMLQVHSWVKCNSNRPCAITAALMVLSESHRLPNVTEFSN